VVDLVEQAIHRARDIARGLQPLQLDKDGLAAALQDLATSVEQMFQVRCHVTCDRRVEADDPANLIHLYRITQEAITNAIRHGRAKNIYVDLVHAGDRIVLSVENDGVGLDRSKWRAGLGTRTMHHRARLIGATLTIEPAVAGGDGVVVTCTMDRPAPLGSGAGAAPPAAGSSESTGGAHAAA
jgi:signal transduction histidine kinase